MEEVEATVESTDVTPDSDETRDESADQGSDSKLDVKGDDESDEKPAAKQKASKKELEDELEEIKIGSVSGKLPKSMAKVVKDLERGFHAKAQEVAKERQERIRREQMREQAKSDRAMLAKLLKEEYGVDPEDFSYQTLEEVVKRAEMSPEARRALELEQENKTLAEKIKEREDRERAEKERKELDEVRGRLDKEIAEAWKESKLPSDVYFVKQIAALMHTSAQLAKTGKTEKPLTAKQAAAIIRKRYEDSQTSILRKLDPEGIHRLLGDEKFNELREWDLKRVTSKAPPTLNSNTRPGYTPASTDNKIKGPVGEREYRRYWAT